LSPIVIRLLAALSALSVAFLAAASAVASEPGADCGSPSDLHDGWVVGAPAQQGLDPTRLCAMEKGISAGRLANVDSILVVRHGVLVYERYFEHPSHRSFDAATRHDGYSMTKSVVSLLVGIALDRDMIKDLDRPVLSYFPEYAALKTPQKDRVTLRNLLTMSSGVNATDSGPMLSHHPDPYRLVLEMPLTADPGASFAYNSPGTELIGAILHKVSGKTLDALARDNLFAPLGITDVDWSGRLGNGALMANSGLSLRPRDWAKIGQLVLNHGAWQGRQIVSASWVAQATAEQIEAPDAMSYGFHWWRGRSLGSGRVIPWIAALGFNAQKMIIVPDCDAVVVFNASRESVQMVAPEIGLLDGHILPAMLPR
jgi:CubicO group peptidase (beta-lactamase class C family)